MSHSPFALPVRRTTQGYIDVAASGFWGGRFERAFFDVRIFNPHASSNRTSLIASSYRRHEQEKRRVYERRVREIEHATFTPFVMSSTGGIGPCATVVLKRLGGLLAEKNAASYSSVMGLLRCRLSFALLRSSIMCIRGSRSRVGTRAALTLPQRTWPFQKETCPFINFLVYILYFIIL